LGSIDVIGSKSKLGELGVIKYLGSKRALLPVLEKLFEASEAKSALDLFTGTTRVAASMKQLGMRVTAVDTASYSEVLAKTFIELDANRCDTNELRSAVSRLNQVSGQAGYFTTAFCQEARFFQEKNGIRIDAIREIIEADYKSSWLYYPLLASLLIATDKIDSTTGVQMAYLKTWSRRSSLELELKVPELIVGSGVSIMADANDVVATLPEVDLAYLDPPYNQHRYFGNYHIWESLVRWDKPEYYGIANKRIDTKSPENKSEFNSKLTMPNALRKLVSNLRAKTLVLSYNNESWLSRRELTDMCSRYESVQILDFDFKRYVGSQIGGYNQAGELVGRPGAKRNLEHIVLAGSSQTVSKMLSSL
jgi:adenine-specific DNA-methyltransferase